MICQSWIVNHLRAAYNGGRIPTVDFNPQAWRWQELKSGVLASRAQSSFIILNLDGLMVVVIN